MKSEKMKYRAIFLDRDGTINVDYGFVHKVKDFEFLPRVVDALKLLSKTDYKLIIITNQSGISRGYFSERDFHVVMDYLIKELRDKNIKVDRIYFCPHSIEDNCNCRKPKIRMLESASNDLSIDLTKSWVIGDKTVDIKMGENAGCKTILVKTGKAGNDKEYNIIPTFIAKDLYEAMRYITKDEQKN